MKLTKQKTGNGTLHLRAQASAEEVAKALDYAYRVFSKTAGLAAKETEEIDRLALEQLRISNLPQHVLPYVMDRLIPLAIDKAGVTPAFVPGGRALTSLVPGNRFEFDCEVTLKPRFELNSYEPVEISVTKPCVFEDDIQREMEKYRPIVEKFSDPDKEEKLKTLIIEKLEYQNANSFEAQKRQAVSIELAKRLEGDIPGEIMRQMYLKLAEGQKARLAEEGTDYKQFLEEHGGKENVEMLTMWQAREILRQGYALDAVFQHEGLALEQEDIGNAACIMSQTDNPQHALAMARELGQMFTVLETAQRFKAANWMLERATDNIREQSPLES